MPRFEVLLTYDDGRREIVNAGRPRCQMQFWDQFHHELPENMHEAAWVAHRAMPVPDGEKRPPFGEWVDTLYDLSIDPEQIEEAVKEGVARPTPEALTPGGKSRG